VLGKMIGDRLKPAPSPRQFNRAVTPAADAIVRRCLAPLTSDRYRSARHLREDLDRHLDDLPLKHTREPSLRERAAKWVRRHPRVASTSTVAAVAAMLLAGAVGAWVVRDRRAVQLEGREALTLLEEQRKEAQFFLTAFVNDADRFQRGIEGSRDALMRHGVLEKPNWLEARRIRLLSDEERRRFREGAAEMLILLARATSMQASQHDPGSAERAEGLGEALRLNRLAESSLGPDGEVRALWRQRADLCHYLGRPDEERACRNRADRIAPNSRTDRYLVATELIADGRLRETARWLREVVEGDPSDARAWMLLGICHDGLGQYPEAVADYSTCIALNPTFPWAYYNLGITRLRQQDYRHAAADFDQALLLQADMKEAHLNRAVARQGLGDYAGAAADLTRALELKAPPTHVLFQRAAAREKAGDAEGAKRDREEAFRLEPTDELGFLSRGYARLAQPERALEDFERACKLNPRSLAALQNKAYALSRLGRSKEAAGALDRAIALYPDFVKARAGRGVMLARLGKREEAHRDADECLARDTQPITHYQLAGVYALTSRTNPEDRARAFHLLRQALAKGVGFDLIESDRDLDPIRNAPEFRGLVAAARAIRPVGGQPGPNRK
jgi:tetratricopeptide (TPR) repeat protein